MKYDRSKLRKLIEALTHQELHESLDDFTAVRNQFTDGQEKYLRDKIILDYFEKHQEEIDKFLERIKDFNPQAYENYKNTIILIREEITQESIKKLLYILNKKLDDSLFFINSFLLSSKFIEEFVLDKFGLKYKLEDLAIKPVSDEICPLIACSEWCRIKFFEQSSQNESFRSLAEEIKNWQTEVIKYRQEAKLDQIKKFVYQSFNKFKELINEEELRIQIEIEPEVDAQRNTGLPTGLFFLNMNLWIKSKELPLGRFAERVVLKPEQFEQGVEQKSNILRMCLEKEDFLSELIRKIRYSLPDKIKPTIEFFVPLGFYQESLENIDFPRGRKRELLGKEYSIFINSFERYFDQDFREIRDEIYERKKALWVNGGTPDSEIYYIGTKPSESDLEMIEEAKAIAVWSRCLENPLAEGNDIKISEWKNWPQTIHKLRKQRKDLEVTLFWDDLYPKPSQRCRPLNTDVVE
ncbi:hypothetical protein A6770_33040 [Nostoc minutum NIES-26]|uniref:Uncharacterized protein n=1 Tax=Nostoc minutum NIES-26 TaxID=1844469 RepID=A0A367Q575_9NOSO|nr:hypothetical protein A6770_33040 [Nostoc minutum NIES-26]